MVKENLTLEENQRKDYNDLLGNYEFTCEGGGAVSEISPILQSRKPGIRLHFLRYGLFDRDSDQITVKTPPLEQENENPHKLDEVEVISLKEAPKVENFYVGRTALNPGYLYLIDENKKDLWHEYEINDNGLFSPVYWDRKYNKDETGNYLDIRKTSEELEDEKVFTQEQVLWIAYSPVQWSADYHKALREDDNKRTERMTKVICSGFKKGETGKNDTQPYNEVVGIFKELQHSECEWLKNTLKQVHAFETYEDEEGENELLEDMFITLHDPIGCAIDISEALNNEIINHQANVEAIRFGKDPKTIAEKIRKKETTTSITPKEQEISNMFSLALTTYRLVYDDPEAIKKYDGGSEGTSLGFLGFIGSTPVVTYDGNGILKEKLTSVLGISERKSQREKIRSLQVDLHNWIKDIYYDKPLVDFVEGSDLCNVIGKMSLTGHTRLLAVNPHDIDRSLDLKKHQENQYPQNDFLENIFTCLDPETNLEKTLDRPVNIDDKMKKDAEKAYFDLTIGVSGFANSLLESIAKLTTKKETTEVIRDMMEVFVTRLNRVSAYGLEMYELSGSQVYDNLPDANTNFDLDPKKDLGIYAGKKDYLRLRVDSPHIVLKHSDHGNHLFEMPVQKSTKVIVEESTAAGAKAKAFVNSKAFRGTVGLLQVFNLGVATVTVINDSSFKNRVI